MPLDLYEAGGSLHSVSRGYYFNFGRLHVVPRRAFEAGFAFHYRNLRGALANLLDVRRSAYTGVPPRNATINAK